MDRHREKAELHGFSGTPLRGTGRILVSPAAMHKSRSAGVAPAGNIACAIKDVH